MAGRERRLTGDGNVPAADEHFRLMAAACDAAAERRPDQTVVRNLTLAGRPARLRVIGPTLAEQVLPAFEHLRVSGLNGDAPTPELSIDLWDEADTGVGCEVCEVGEDLAADGRYSASSDGRYVVQELAQTKSAFDRVAGRIVGWAGTGSRLTLYESGRPLHSHLLLWHKDRGVQAIHAGLVARDGEGVLFGGPGGSGKSTVALSCHLGGFDYLGDDYVGLQRSAEHVYTGHSLYCSTHVEPDHLRRFPHLLDHAVSGTLKVEDKQLVFLSRATPERLESSATIRAVALPTVVDAPTTTVRRASTVEALLRLAPSSLLMLPHAGTSRHEFERLSLFLDEVPAFWLDLGRDLAEIPSRVEDVLTEAVAG